MKSWLLFLAFVPLSAYGQIELVPAFGLSIPLGAYAGSDFDNDAHQGATPGIGLNLETVYRFNDLVGLALNSGISWNPYNEAALEGWLERDSPDNYTVSVNGYENVYAMIGPKIYLGGDKWGLSLSPALGFGHTNFRTAVGYYPGGRLYAYLTDEFGLAYGIFSTAEARISDRISLGLHVSFTSGRYNQTGRTSETYNGITDSIDIDNTLKPAAVLIGIAGLIRL